MFCCLETKIANKHKPFVQQLGFSEYKIRRNELYKLLAKVYFEYNEYMKSLK
jgi:hypothetical protein